MREKTLKFLGLMRRANALQVGENNTGEAVRAGKAKLLLLAEDASDNARKRAESFVGGRSCLLLCLPFSKEELSSALGLGGCSMAAVTDLGFANALINRLRELDPDAYVGFLYADRFIDTEEYVKKHGGNALHPAIYFLLNPETVRKAAELGLDINVWTVDEIPHLHMACQMHLTTLITNYPDRALSVVTQYTK